MKKAFIIGIAGGSSSGKSSVCEKLANKFSMLKTNIIHMDDYFKPESERPFSKAFITGKEYIDDNHPLTIDMDKIKIDFLKSIMKINMIL
jgi:uridine kinase